MQMTRTFFYLLLAANLVLALLSGLSLAGQQAPWQQAGETERLKRQLAVDKIALLSNSSETSQPVAPVALTASAPPASEQSAPATIPDTPACAALKGLGAEDIAQITTLALPLSEKIKLQSSGVQPTSWWVNIPPGGGKEGAVRRGEILAKAGITDYIIVREAGPNQFAISLGLFRSEEAAKRLTDQLQKKNIKTARITVRDNSNARVELRGMSSTLTPLLEEIQSRIKSAQREDCQPG